MCARGTLLEIFLYIYREFYANHYSKCHVNVHEQLFIFGFTNVLSDKACSMKRRGLERMFIHSLLRDGINMHDFYLID